ncbi:Ig-like domain-containing protein, partial [bacterium]|nr:Ig-like domain-containing protein [bacterium]
MKSSGDGQTGTAGTALPLPLVAQAVDQSNQPVPNQPIVWTVTNGFLTNTIAVTDTGGFTQTTLTCGLKPGPVTATAAT